MDSDASDNMNTVIASGPPDHNSAGDSVNDGWVTFSNSSPNMLPLASAPLPADTSTTASSPQSLATDLLGLDISAGAPSLATSSPTVSTATGPQPVGGGSLLDGPDFSSGTSTATMASSQPPLGWENFDDRRNDIDSNQQRVVSTAFDASVSSAFDDHADLQASVRGLYAANSAVPPASQMQGQNDANRLPDDLFG